MTHVLPRVGAAILAMFALLATVLVAIPANAAPPYQTNASIDSLEFQQDEIKSGSVARIDGTWSLPDNPTTPAASSSTCLPNCRAVSTRSTSSIPRASQWASAP